MNAFAIASFVYVGCGMALALWGIATMKRRAGVLTNDFWGSRKEIAAVVRAKATSPWDLFSDTGGRRWQLIFGIGFAALVVLNFSGL